jgi:hypothetical protein
VGELSDGMVLRGSEQQCVGQLVFRGDELV